MYTDMIHHPNTVIGLGDGGAHLNLLQEAGCPTYMLTHWARDHTKGPKMPLEEAVRLQTSATANLIGLKDRGAIQPGLRADLNIIDFENLQLVTPEVVQDLPAGSTRWVQRSQGYDMTILKG